MKNNMRVASITAFALAVPSLIVVDWYYKGAGVAVMFFFLTIGLVIDQIIRLQYPSSKVYPIQTYRINRSLNIVALILYIQSPMALIYVNHKDEKLGFWIMVIMIFGGITLNQISRWKYQYSHETEE